MVAMDPLAHPANQLSRLGAHPRRTRSATQPPSPRLDRHRQQHDRAPAALADLRPAGVAQATSVLEKLKSMVQRRGQLDAEDVTTVVAQVTGNDDTRPSGTP